MHLSCSIHCGKLKCIFVDGKLAHWFGLCRASATVIRKTRQLAAQCDNEANVKLFM